MVRVRWRFLYFPVWWFYIKMEWYLQFSGCAPWEVLGSISQVFSLFTLQIQSWITAFFLFTSFFLSHFWKSPTMYSCTKAQRESTWIWLLGELFFFSMRINDSCSWDFPGLVMKCSPTDLAWLEETVAVLNSECVLLGVFFWSWYFNNEFSLLIRMHTFLTVTQLQSLQMAILLLLRGIH